MRLFTALWPPPDAVAELAAALRPDDVPAGWRAMDSATWHLTLAFHGDAEPGVLARALEGGGRGLPAPRLRIAGTGAFDGVRWAGVEADPPADLHTLVTVAGGDLTRFVPHVTLLRRRARSGPDPAVELPVPAGSWWRPDEILLVSSEPGRRGPRYRVVHRVPLA